MNTLANAQGGRSDLTEEDKKNKVGRPSDQSVKERAEQMFREMTSVDEDLERLGVKVN